MYCTTTTQMPSTQTNTTYTNPSSSDNTQQTHIVHTTRGLMWKFCASTIMMEVDDQDIILVIKMFLGAITKVKVPIKDHYSFNLLLLGQLQKTMPTSYTSKTSWLKSFWLMHPTHIVDCCSNIVDTAESCHGFPITMMTWGPNCSKSTRNLPTQSLDAHLSKPTSSKLETLEGFLDGTKLMMIKYIQTTTDSHYTNTPHRHSCQ